MGTRGGCCREARKGHHTWHKWSPGLPGASWAISSLHLQHLMGLGSTWGLAVGNSFLVGVVSECLGCCSESIFDPQIKSEVLTLLLILGCSFSPSPNSSVSFLSPHPAHPLGCYILASYTASPLILAESSDRSFAGAESPRPGLVAWKMMPEYRNSDQSLVLRASVLLGASDRGSVTWLFLVFYLHVSTWELNTRRSGASCWKTIRSTLPKSA